MNLFTNVLKNLCFRVYNCKHLFVYLCNWNKIFMDLKSWYRVNFESRIKGRYVTLEHILPIINSYHDHLEITSAGTSELGNDIPLLKIGTGKKVVLGWSQMHGNESTTTKAIFDFLKFLFQQDVFQDEIEKFHESYTFYIIPILNPDGAKSYNRVNSNDIDLNRDARDLSQAESKALRKTFERVKPQLCLNLHDQRSIYGLSTDKPATVSFLAPAADKRRTVTESRKIAMQHIVRMNEELKLHIPGQVGRYDDTFNGACVGDTFQHLQVPTILFEAGHYRNDYQREKTREFIFYAYISLFDFFKRGSFNYKDYFNIPENNSKYRDIILKNVRIANERKPVDIAIQLVEELDEAEIIFVPTIDSIVKSGSLLSHKSIDLKGASVLVNSQEKIRVGQKVSTIVNKDDEKVIILQEK